MDTNNVVLVGRLTKDMEMKYTNSGKAVGSFTLAVGGFKKEDVSFFDCQAWGKTAENLNQYLVKGKQISITGSLLQQRWEKDGQKRSKVIVNVQSIQLLGGNTSDSNSNSRGGNPQQSRQQSNSPESFESDGFDDVPF